MFLLKPHVTGPKGQITTPDIVVDCLIVDGQKRALGLLTHDAWQGVEPDAKAQAGYGVMALGGGALILPVLVLSNGFVVAARCAWRLNNLDDHIGEVTLNGAGLSEVGLPSALIAQVGAKGDALPRGFLLVQTSGEALSGPVVTATLSDPKLDRSLTHNLHLTSVEQDRWGDARPQPRYSVGPTQKEVPHFI
ncbi:MAG: hypothetical protein AB3N23_01240 [Paracoccaceae bacterium]